MSSKIVQHPSSVSTPSMTIAEAVGLVPHMTGCCVMWTGTDGERHIAWSNMGNEQLSAFAVILTHIASDRLIHNKND